MKTIKFRAWDKKDNKMIYSNHDEFRSDEESELALEIGGQPIQLSHEQYYPWSKRLKDIELMQFTGLKDIKGKEIWKNDIVKCDIRLSDNSVYARGVGIVKYGKFKTSGDGQGSGNNICIGYYLDKLAVDTNGWQDNISILNWDTIEVIGNKFENPKLLEKLK